MAAFTTIATAAGLAISATAATSSFVQAGKQRKKQDAAQRDAEEAMDKAKAKLQTNFYEGLSIQKEPYELAREADISGLTSIVQAGQAGERGAGEIAGRAALYNQAGQAQTRTAMGKEMQALDKLIATEDSRLRDARVNINLGEVAGQQQIAADAREARAAANQAGVSGLMSLGTQAMKIPELYGSDNSMPTTAVGGQLVSNKLIENSPTRFGTNAAGETVNLMDVFKADKIFAPFEAVTIPTINPTPLSQQYDSVTGRLIQ